MERLNLNDSAILHSRCSCWPRMESKFTTNSRRPILSQPRGGDAWFTHACRNWSAFPWAVLRLREIFFLRRCFFLTALPHRRPRRLRLSGDGATNSWRRRRQQTEGAGPSTPVERTSSLNECDTANGIADCRTPHVSCWRGAPRPESLSTDSTADLNSRTNHGHQPARADLAWNPLARNSNHDPDSMTYASIAF